MKTTVISLILCFVLGVSICQSADILSLFREQSDLSKLKISSDSRKIDSPRVDYGIETVGYEKSCENQECINITYYIERDGSIVRYTQSDEGEIKRKGTLEDSYIYLLHEYIVNSEYFKLDDMYSLPITDIPVRIFMVKKPPITKFVFNGGNAAPSSIWALEAITEHIISNVSWDDE